MSSDGVSEHALDADDHKLIQDMYERALTDIEQVSSAYSSPHRSRLGDISGVIAAQPAAQTVAEEAQNTYAAVASAASTAADAAAATLAMHLVPDQLKEDVARMRSHIDMMNKYDTDKIMNRLNDIECFDTDNAWKMNYIDVLHSQDMPTVQERLRLAEAHANRALLGMVAEHQVRRMAPPLWTNLGLGCSRFKISASNSLRKLTSAQIMSEQLAARIPSK